MKEDLICLREELDLIEQEKKSRKIKKSEDKAKYLILIFYILVFFSLSFLNSNEYENNFNKNSCLSNKKEKGFFGWTCEYCKGYNPPAVATCQTCRKPRGY